ncbi:HAD family hydrolase [Streptomyces hainanensis]|uniref:HAD family hydrolase n=1 Tax=Streptomyces hainanensis TaxID=402648 RepID=A0A4R4SYF5_9ACTN|nr:haloacid dehalogenase-like hydrolase [Streptomyces hainanensis]TDC67542.1 HAD family hydrolase [Streptomyces hainanensis]
MSDTRESSALILWDIDHTLLNIAGVSREIYELAFEEVAGHPLRDLAPMAGRTEQAIAFETLEMNGVEASQALISRFYTALGAAAESLSSRIRDAGKALPGAREAIFALQRRPVVQSVVTGNIRSVAGTKLRAFGLAESLDLEVGGYGDDGSDRATLVRLARERAEEKYRASFPGKRTFVIGDTPHDIRGAHDAGVFAVGVATGYSSFEELTECGADLVLTDLTDTEALCGAVRDSQAHESSTSFPWPRSPGTARGTEQRWACH